MPYQYKWIKEPSVLGIMPYLLGRVRSCSNSLQKQPGLRLGRKGRLVEFILTLREYRFRVQGLYVGVLVYRVASLGF